MVFCALHFRPSASFSQNRGCAERPRMTYRSARDGASRCPGPNPGERTYYNISYYLVKCLRMGGNSIVPRGRARSSECAPDQKMIERDRATAAHQEIESRRGPQQREFDAHLVPEEAAHSPAFEVRHDEENDDRAGSEARE